MSYQGSDEERLFAEVVRGFATRELAPLVDEAERTGVFPRARVVPRMAELGLLGIGVPEVLGGAGGTSLMHCIVGEEVARVCGGFAIAVMASVLAPAAVVRLTGGKASGALLAPLLRGEIMPAMAFTEPGAGSDVGAIRTTVRKTDEGLVLRGAKTFISNAPTADVFLVAAVREDHAGLPRAERAKGLGVYVAMRGAKGLEVGRSMSKLGMRSSETGELSFDDVPVLSFGAVARDSASAPTGPSAAGERPADLGMRAMMALLDFNRLYIAALSIGIAQAAFEASLAHVKERVAFDKPIAQHQATGFKLARMATKLDASRALVERACAAHDRGERATRAISEAKLFATEAAVEIASDAVQIHGGYGYSEESPVARYFRDARVGTIWEGTSEIQQMIICRELGLYD